MEYLKKHTQKKKQYSKEPAMEMYLYLAWLILMKWRFNLTQIKTPDYVGPRAIEVENCAECNSENIVLNNFS